ncbi:UBX domain-containing protein 1-A-like [Metopolophium dirhodum]|uniref:UBX domain-containing protein 1-A-like n=1 Tax=Metopolophium dirhodum TaxID=44670 RepID=UPI00298FB73A|nr:UBX domain-containing protein 1-A-like [Metopolophium dirhodum]
MSRETVQILIDMGFQKEKAENSVSMTGNQGAKPAIEWLLAHNDDEMGPSTSQDGSTSNTNSETNTSPATVTKSYKCEECNKLFADTTALEYHAIKSGHSSNFAGSTEEIKPLTDDEKKEQMKKLEERLKKNREERNAKEKKEELERKKIRIHSGKEKATAKKKLDDEDIKKIMDERKRGKKKDYTQTKLKICLTNGQTIVQTFNIKEIMAAVRVYIELNRSDGDAPFGLMTRFPRKVFTCDDYEKSLDQLGLVPSAVLTLTKPQQ